MRHWRMSVLKQSTIAVFVSSFLWFFLAESKELEAKEAGTLGEEHWIQQGENLLDLARNHGLGYVEILAANPGIDPWVPQVGVRILLPTVHLPPAGMRDGALVVNMGDMRLYRKVRGGEIESYPVGIGREGWELRSSTRVRVSGKRVRPTWVPPPSVRAEKPWLPSQVPPGEDNPLGAYSLDLSPGLLRIHGTNLPDGVGRRVSHGCIRMYPEDIQSLFSLIKIGTPVVFIDEPVKISQKYGALWLEIHPGQENADAIESHQQFFTRPLPNLEAMVRSAATAGSFEVDWEVVSWAEATRFGLPVRISRDQAESFVYPP